MSATPGRARSPSRSPACAAPFRSCTCCSFGHTLPYSVSYPSPLLLHIRQKLPLPPNQTPGLPRLPSMLLKPLLKSQRPLAKPSKRKPEFAMTQAQWQAEGRLKLELACRWKWWLVRVDVERRLDSLWSPLHSRRIISRWQREFLSLIFQNVRHEWLMSLIFHVLQSFKYPVLFSSSYLGQECQWIIVYSVQYMYY